MQLHVYAALSLCFYPLTQSLSLLPPHAHEQEIKTGFNAFAASSSASTSTASNNKSNAASAQAELRRKVGEDAARSFHASQVERTHQQALAEDPSVFDYDNVYDDMTSKRASKASQRKAQRESEKKQPKYIANLMEKAKIREIEGERIRERRLLNERKTEDSLYGDKEKLISASYKRKLMELKKWDVEDARLDALEDAEDVTKRGEHAMAGFYANLLNKNISMGGSTENAKSAYTVGREGKEDIKKKTESDDEAHEEEPSEKRRRRAYDDEGRETVDETAKGLQAVESRGGEREPQRESALPSIAAPREPQESKAKAPPPPSKDDAISAAKARFLARKAQREAAGKADL